MARGKSRRSESKSSGKSVAKLSTQSIRTLTTKALKGDSAAESELRSRAAKIAKQANRRILNLERGGLTASPAYKLAKDDIFYIKRQRKGLKTRYPETNVSLSIIEVEAILESANMFLGRKTSTASGYKAYVSKRKAGLAKIGLSTEGREELVNEFLNTDWFNEFKRFDSIDAIREVDRLADSGVDPEEIEELYNQYLEGKKTFTEVAYDWEKYVEIE